MVPTPPYATPCHFTIQMGNWQDTIHVRCSNPLPCSTSHLRHHQSMAGNGYASTSQQTGEPFFFPTHPGGFLYHPAASPQNMGGPIVRAAHQSILTYSKLRSRGSPVETTVHHHLHIWKHLPSQLLASLLEFCRLFEIYDNNLITNEVSHSFLQLLL